MGIQKSIKYILSGTNKVNAGIVKSVSFNEFTENKPNVFQIRNFGVNTLYVSIFSSISSTKYDVTVLAGSTEVLTDLTQNIDSLYLLSSSDADVVINASYSDDIKATDLDRTQQSIILNYTSPPEVTIDDSVPIDVNVTNTSTIEGLLTDIKDLLTITNTKLGTIETDIELINTNLGTLETDVELINTNLGTLETDVELINTNLGTIDSVLDAHTLLLTDIEINTTP